MYITPEENRRIISRMKSEISILDYAVKLGFTPKRVGSYYTLKEHDSVRIDPNRNIFYRNRNSAPTGRSIFDFLMEFQDGIKNFHDAAAALGAAHYWDKAYVNKPLPKVKQYNTERASKDFVLPERDDNVKNVYAYLIGQRCIEKKIVAWLINEGYIKQDKHKNCMFIGYDDPGSKDRKPVFACLRGTNTYKTFKGDISGNDYSKGFYIDNGKATLCVTESPIDSLSMMTLAKINGDDPFGYNYLSLAGVGKYKCLFSRLKDGGINKIILCLDNDEAGRAAEEKIIKEIHNHYSTIQIEKPVFTEKDINEALCAIIRCKRENSREEVKDDNTVVTSCHNRDYDMHL